MSPLKFSINWKVLVVGVATTLAAPSGAFAQDPDLIDDPVIVVATTVKTKQAALSEAKRAANRLNLPLAMALQREIPKQRSIKRPTVSLHYGPAGNIVISTFLGRADEADLFLKTTRKVYPEAELRPIRRPVSSTGADVFSEWLRAPLLVVGSFRDYQEAERAAKTYAIAANMTYDTLGRVFDEERGLVLPDNDPDETWAGHYIERRDDYACTQGDASIPCVTIERSEAYPGLTPNLYIVVAGILYEESEATDRLQAARKIEPTAYAPTTDFYHGCRH